MANDPKTASDAFEELHRAMSTIVWALVDSLRLPQIIEWLARQINRVTDDAPITCDICGWSTAKWADNTTLNDQTPTHADKLRVHRWLAHSIWGESAPQKPSKVGTQLERKQKRQ